LQRADQAGAGVSRHGLREANLLRDASDYKASLFVDVMDLAKTLDRKQCMDVILGRFEKGGQHRPAASCPQSRSTGAPRWSGALTWRPINETDCASEDRDPKETRPVSETSKPPTPASIGATLLAGDHEQTATRFVAARLDAPDQHLSSSRRAVRSGKRWQAGINARWRPLHRRERGGKE
jgi:hypothetical protein